MTGKPSMISLHCKDALFQILWLASTLVFLNDWNQCHPHTSNGAAEVCHHLGFESHERI
jgi:hypothetical protein